VERQLIVRSQAFVTFPASEKVLVGRVLCRLGIC